MGNKQRVAVTSLASLALTMAFEAPFVYADNFGVVIQRGNGYGIVGGDTYKVNGPPPSWQQLSGKNVLITTDLVDGRSVIQGDTAGETLNNGYIAIYPNDVDSWVTHLQGNQQWVERKTGNEEFSIYDTSAYDTTRLVPFMDVANQSGAIVGSDQYVRNGGYYNGKPTYTYEMTLKPSNPPTVNSFLASVSGGQVTFNANVNVPLWGSLAKYHYDAIYVVGQKTGGQWVVGNSSTDDTQDGAMVSKSGSQNSSIPDSFTATLQPDTYTATFWVGDGVDRVSMGRTITFTVSTGGTGSVSGAGGQGNGNSGVCPPPSSPPPKPANYVEGQSWSCNGNGSETLAWTDSNWVLKTSTTASRGCTITTYQWVDQPLTYSHTYDSTLVNLAITGLFYDPGTPNNPWFPWNQSAFQSNNDALTDGSTVGGSPALPTYGNPNAEPAVYVRIGGGFAFRIMWVGSPNSMPSGGTATYKLTNPDGSTKAWTKPFSILPATENNMGTYIDPNAGTAGYPSYASEYGYIYTNVPKYAISPALELAKWNLDGNLSTTSKISIKLQVNNACGTVTWNDPLLAQSFSYPVYYFNHEIPSQGDLFLRPQPNFSKSVITP